MMKKLLLLGVAVLCAIGFMTQLATQKVKHRPSDLPLDITDTVVASAATEAFATTGAPGMVVTMYRGAIEQPAVSLALGHVDLAQSRSIKTDDRFRMGDMALSLLGYVALILHTAGQLDSNAPLSTYLPDVPNGEAISVAMLGCHTSGLADPTQSAALKQAVTAGPTQEWTDDDVLAYAAALDVSGAPGEGWMYSRTNGIYLARVIEQVTGGSWHEALQSYLFDPLGMASTTDARGAPDASLSGYHYAAPGAPFETGTTLMDVSAWSASWMGAAGGLYSTERDVAVFARAAGNAELINRESRKLLRKWRETDAPYFEHGFMAWDYFGAFVLTGDVPGASSFAAYLSDLDVTVVVLANLSRDSDGQNPARNVGLQLTDLLYGIK